MEAIIGWDLYLVGGREEVQWNSVDEGAEGVRGGHSGPKVSGDGWQGTGEWAV